jgi:hypothetical protein
MKKIVPEVFEIPIGSGLIFTSEPALAASVALSDLTSVNLSSVADKNILQFSSASSKWVNVPQTDLVDGGNF